jgi:hypothetical protein
MPNQHRALLWSEKMKLLYDHQRQRICLTWKDPVKARYQGKDVVISKQRTRSVRVSKKGKLCMADCTKFEDPNHIRDIMRFCRELENAGAFAGFSAKHACSVCGTVENTKACFDERSGKLVWRCPMHVAAAKESAINVKPV